MWIRSMQLVVILWHLHLIKCHFKIASQCCLANLLQLSSSVSMTLWIIAFLHHVYMYIDNNFIWILENQQIVFQWCYVRHEITIKHMYISLVQCSFVSQFHGNNNRGSPLEVLVKSDGYFVYILSALLGFWVGIKPVVEWSSQTPGFESWP